MDERTIRTARAALDATARPPGAKSLAARALLCAVLAEGESRLSGLPAADDVQALLAALRALGFAVRGDPPGEVAVIGAGGEVPAARARLDLRGSGTGLRFLLPLIALGRGSYRVDGEARMRERPVAGLLAALQLLGVDAVSETGSGCPPVLVRRRPGAPGPRGGELHVPGEVSSQYLSALLLAAPALPDGLDLSTGEDAVSLPYVDMTVAVMNAFGVEVGRGASRSWRVAPGSKYHAREYEVEPDASGAAYIWGAALAAGGRALVRGIRGDLPQPDLAFLDIARAMGGGVETLPEGLTVSFPRGSKLRGVDVDLGGTPDLVPTVAALALLADGPTTIAGAAHLRHKESDRIASVAAAARVLGGVAEERSDGLRILGAGARGLHGGSVATAGDHRIAMAFSLVGLAVEGVRIQAPACVAKSFPGYWETFESLY